MKHLRRGMKGWILYMLIDRYCPDDSMDLMDISYNGR